MNKEIIQNDEYKKIIQEIKTRIQASQIKASISVNKELLKLRNKILENICYTELVYGRINKKLNIHLSNEEIENYMYEIIADHSCIIKKKGKNLYIENIEKNVKITVNSNTYRIITADKL